MRKKQETLDNEEAGIKTLDGIEEKDEKVEVDKIKADIKKQKVTSHSLRHNFSTNLQHLPLSPQPPRLDKLQAKFYKKLHQFLERPRVLLFV